MHTNSTRASGALALCITLGCGFANAEVDGVAGQWHAVPAPFQGSAAGAPAGGAMRSMQWGQGMQGMGGMQGMSGMQGLSGMGGGRGLSGMQGMGGNEMGYTQQGPGMGYPQTGFWMPGPMPGTGDGQPQRYGQPSYGGGNMPGMTAPAMGFPSGGHAMDFPQGQTRMPAPQGWAAPPQTGTPTMPGYGPAGPWSGVQPPATPPSIPAMPMFQGPSSEDGTWIWVPKLRPGTRPAPDTEVSPAAEGFTGGPDSEEGPSKNR